VCGLDMPGMKAFVASRIDIYVILKSCVREMRKPAN
jgi:hypothetical protein